MGLYTMQNIAFEFHTFFAGRLSKVLGSRQLECSKHPTETTYLPRHPSSVATAFASAKTSCSMERSLPGYAIITGAEGLLPIA